MQALAILVPLSTAALTIYFLPTLVAWRRRHKNIPAVFMLNLLCPPIFVALVILCIAIWQRTGGL